MEALITVSLVIAVLITLFVSVLVVAVVKLRAAHAQWLLDGHFLPPQLHGIHQVIDSGHGPHGRRVPGLHVAIFPHQQHREILRADLEVVPHVFDQGAWQTFTFHSCAPCKGQTFRRIKKKRKDCNNEIIKYTMWTAPNILGKYIYFKHSFGVMQIYVFLLINCFWCC